MLYVSACIILHTSDDFVNTHTCMLAMCSCFLSTCTRSDCSPAPAFQSHHCCNTRTLCVKFGALVQAASITTAQYNDWCWGTPPREGYCSPVSRHSLTKPYAASEQKALNNGAVNTHTWWGCVRVWGGGRQGGTCVVDVQEKNAADQQRISNMSGFETAHMQCMTEWQQHMLVNSGGIPFRPSNCAAVPTADSRLA